MRTILAGIAITVLAVVVSACSSEDEPEPAAAPPETAEAAEPLKPGSAPPPSIAALPPQPPGPAPQTVPALPQPAMRMPATGEGQMNLAGARAKSQFFAMDNRNPVVNGSFERWEKPGPIYWHGNFTYKKPEDPPEQDIQMYPSTWDGEWALRFMPKGTYIEVYQDVDLPELDGAAILDAVAYVRNPIPEGFAIRLAYVADGQPQVAEIYPAQTDGSWTWYHARIELPPTLAPGSARVYLTRDAQVQDNVIVDGLMVRVIGATGAAAAPEA